MFTPVMSARESESGVRRSTRRQFVRLTAVVAGSTVLGAAATSTAGAAEPVNQPPSGVPGDGIAGHVIGAHLDALTVSSHGRVVRIEPVQGAVLYAGIAGTVRTPAGFVIGDFIVAQGKYVGSVFHASNIGSTLLPFLAKVATIPGDGYFTTQDGSLIDASRLTLPGVDAASGGSSNLTVGDLVEGPSWTDPRDQSVYLFVSSSA